MSRRKIDPVLEKLGLTPEEVRAAFGVEEKKEPKKKKGYLYRDEQQKMNKRMKHWERMVYARFMGGMHPGVIAGVIGVSEETVRVRLRASGFFNNPTSKKSTKLP